MKNRSLQFHHWLIFGLVNGVVFYISGLLFPEEIVLGNASVSVLAAVVLAALVVTLTISLMPVITRQLNIKKMPKTRQYLVYAAVNILVLWLLSRLALVFGFGLASKYTTISLGTVLTIVQYLYWEYAVRKIA